MKNNQTKGIFVDIMSGEVDSITSFINDEKSLKQTKYSRMYMNEYKALSTELMDKFEKLGDLEVLVLQHRSLNNITNLKFSAIRNEYIYARAPFYRKGNQVKDIRVIVAKVSDVTNNPDKLPKIYKEEGFIELAKTKLAESMKKEIEDTRNEYIKKYS